MTDEYITKAQAEKIAGVSRRLIQQWIDAGAIREYRRAGGGGYAKLKRSEVERAAQIVPADGEAREP